MNYSSLSPSLPGFKRTGENSFSEDTTFIGSQVKCFSECIDGYFPHPNVHEPGLHGLKMQMLEIIKTLPQQMIIPRFELQISEEVGSSTRVRETCPENENTALLRFLSYLVTEKFTPEQTALLCRIISSSFMGTRECSVWVLRHQRGVSVKKMNLSLLLDYLVKASQHSDLFEKEEGIFQPSNSHGSLIREEHFECFQRVLTEAHKGIEPQSVQCSPELFDIAPMEETAQVVDPSLEMDEQRSKYCQKLGEAIFIWQGHNYDTREDTFIKIRNTIRNAPDVINQSDFPDLHKFCTNISVNVVSFLQKSMHVGVSGVLKLDELSTGLTHLYRIKSRIDFSSSVSKGSKTDFSFSVNTEDEALYFHGNCFSKFMYCLIDFSKKENPLKSIIFQSLFLNFKSETLAVDFRNINCKNSLGGWSAKIVQFFFLACDCNLSLLDFLEDDKIVEFLLSSHTNNRKTEIVLEILLACKKDSAEIEIEIENTQLLNLFSHQEKEVMALLFPRISPEKKYFSFEQLLNSRYDMATSRVTDDPMTLVDDVDSSKDFLGEESTFSSFPLETCPQGLIDPSLPHSQLNISQESHIVSSSVFDQAKLKKEFSILVDMITEHWYHDPVCHALLIEMYREQKGDLSIPLNSQNREIILKPFLEFYSKSSSPVRKKLIEKSFVFFGIHSNIEEIFPTTDSTSIDSLSTRDQNIKILCELVSSSITFSDSSDLITSFQSNELAPTVLANRLQEFRLFMRDNPTFLNYTFNDSKELPLYLISEDGSDVRIEIFRAVTDQNGESLRRVLSGNAESPNYMRQLLGTDLVVKEDENSQHVILSLSDFHKLVTSIGLSNTLDCYVLYRERTLPQQGLCPPVSEEDYLQGQSNEEASEVSREEKIRPKKRRKKDAESIPDSMNTDMDLLLPSPSKTQSVPNSKIERKGRESFKPPKDRGDFQSISKLQKGGQKRKKQGPIGMVSTSSLPSGDAYTCMSLQEVSIDLNAPSWKIQALQALNKINSRVAPEMQRRRALNETIPLSYPIIKELDATQSSMELDHSSIYVPGLKGYQNCEIEETIRLHDLGIGRIDAFQMGLGKSWVVSGIIYSLAALNGPGWNVVLTPQPVVSEFYQKIQDFLNQAEREVWSVAGMKLTITPDHIKRKEWVESYIQRLTFALTSGQQVDEKFPSQLLAAFSRFKFSDGEYEKLFIILKSKAYTLSIPTSFAEKLEGKEGEIRNKIKHAIDQLNGIQNPWKNSLSEAISKECFAIEDLNELLEIDTHTDKKLTRIKLELAGHLHEIALGLYPDINAKTYSSGPLNHLISLITSCQLIQCKDGKILKVALCRLDKSKENKSVVIVTTIESIRSLYPSNQKNIERDQLQLQDKFQKFFKNRPWRSFIVDEGHLAKNHESNSHKIITNFISFIKSGSPNCLFNLPTATPLPNKFSDLWNLLEAINGGKFDPTTLTSLGKLKQGVEDQLVNYAVKGVITEPNVELEIRFLRSFVQHLCFRRTITDRLVGYRTAEDPFVQECWDKKIPTKQISKVDVSVHPSAMEPLKIIDQKHAEKATKEVNMLGYGSDVLKILLHPSMINLTLNSKERGSGVKSLLSGLAEGNQNLIEESTLLSAAKSFMEKELVGVEERTPNKSIIFVVEHQIIAEAIKAVFDTNFNSKETKRVISELFTGETKQEDREKIKNWFKTKGGAKGGVNVLILSLGVGGVGLDFPDAERMYFFASGWNPSQENQAFYRILRAGSTGVREIVIPVFKDQEGNPLPYQLHRDIIKDSKTHWETFLLRPEEQTLARQLKLWSRVSEGRVHHRLLTKQMPKVDLEELNTQMDNVRGLLKELEESLSESVLKEALEKVQPLPGEQMIQNLAVKSPYQPGQLPMWLKSGALESFFTCLLNTPNVLRTLRNCHSPVSKKLRSTIDGFRYQGISGRSSINTIGEFFSGKNGFFHLPVSVEADPSVFFKMVFEELKLGFELVRQRPVQNTSLHHVLSLPVNERTDMQKLVRSFASTDQQVSRGPQGIQGGYSIKGLLPSSLIIQLNRMSLAENGVKTYNQSSVLWNSDQLDLGYLADINVLRQENRTANYQLVSYITLLDDGKTFGAIFKKDDTWRLSQNHFTEQVLSAEEEKVWRRRSSFFVMQRSKAPFISPPPHIFAHGDNRLPPRLNASIQPQSIDRLKKSCFTAFPIPSQADEQKNLIFAVKFAAYCRKGVSSDAGDGIRKYVGQVQKEELKSESVRKGEFPKSSKLSHLYDEARGEDYFELVTRYRIEIYELDIHSPSFNLQTVMGNKTSEERLRLYKKDEKNYYDVLLRN